MILMHRLKGSNRAAVDSSMLYNGEGSGVNGCSNVEVVVAAINPDAFAVAK